MNEGDVDPVVEAALAELLRGRTGPFIPSPADVRRALDAAARATRERPSPFAWHGKYGVQPNTGQEPPTIPPPKPSDATQAKP